MATIFPPSKDNYRAWQIDYNDFYKQKTEKEKLRFLLKFAVLAPSSHNSQPWKFVVEENRILFMVNEERATKVSDPDQRLLHIALGCALENLLIAANYYGYETKMEYHIENHPEAIVTVSFEKSAVKRGPQENHLIFSIPKRHTNRSRYTSSLPDKALLDFISNLSTEEIRIDIISNETQKNKIADIMMKAREKAFSNRGFREELARYKRTNFTNSSTGMPGFTMGFGNLFSLVAPFLIKYINIMKFIKSQEKELLKKYTPIFIIISTRLDTKENWIKVGQLFERIALAAERVNLRTAINAIPPKVQELQDVLRLSNYRPQIFFRMGYSKKLMPHSPRLSVLQVAG